MSETDQINACNLAFMEALRQGDAEKCASLYDVNGVLMPPNEPPVKGREAIKQYFANRGPDLTVAAETLEFEVSGGIAYEHSRLRRDSNGQSKYIDALDVPRKQDDDTWMFFVSAWNSNEGV